MHKLISKITNCILKFLREVIKVGNKIIYNGNEYNGTIVNDTGVGEFTSNSGKKNLTGSNNERFNDYQNNAISNGTYMTVTGSSNTANSCNNSILTGNSNISGTANSSIIAGTSNQLYNFSNSIIDGDHVYAAGSSNCTSNIIFGNDLSVTGNTIKNNVINGYGYSSENKFSVTGTNIFCNYMNGASNNISGNTVQNNIITGQGNSLINPSYNLLIGGSNTMSGGSYGWQNTIIGGSNTMSQLSDYQNAAAHSDPQYDTIIGDNNYITGIRNTVIGMYQCIVGQGNVAIGQTGNGSIGSGEYDTAFKSSDRKTFLDTYYPVAVPTEGANSGIVEGHYCYKEGSGTIIGYNPGDSSYNGLPSFVHIEGFQNVSIGGYNHIEGWGNLGNCEESHVEGRNNLIADVTTGSQTSGTIDDAGTTSRAGKPRSSVNHVEGSSNVGLYLVNTHVEGYDNKGVTVTYSHIEGYSNEIVNSSYNHIEGQTNSIINSTLYSHIEGVNNEVNGGISCSHIEGHGNAIRGGISYAHIEGYLNVLDGSTNKSHAEGDSNAITSGSQIGHVEGQNNIINNGSQVVHIEGKNNITSSNAMYAHAEGWGTQIQGRSSHAQNIFTAAKSNGQTAIGIANIADTANTYALIVGNGSYTTTSLLQYSESSTYNTDDEVIYNGKVYKCLEDGVTGEWDSTKWDLETIEIIDGQEITRSNALTLDWSGNLTTTGNVTANGVTLTNANPNISDEYDSTATYAIGDYCIYNNSFYKCNTAITVAEDFDDTKWTATTVGSELLLLKSAIDTLTAQLNGFTISSAMSQTDYDNLGTYDANTIYPIV